MAVPGLALADETETPLDSAPAEEVAAVEVTAPADQAAPALEEAPAEEAAVDEAPPVVEEVAAPQASTALASRPSTTIGSRVGQRLAGQARARAAKSGPPATSKARTSAVTKLSDHEINCSDESLKEQWSLVAGTPSFANGETTFTWTLRYTPTEADDGDERCAFAEEGGISHLTITVCMQATGSSPEAELTNGPSYSYKWDAQEPVDGDEFSLVFDGEVAGAAGESGNSAEFSKGWEDSDPIFGPDCSPSQGCETYTLSTGVASTPSGASGTITVTGVGDADDTGPWAAGEAVSLDAPTISDYTFTGWTGDRTGSTDPLEVTFATTDDDCVVSVTANYTPDEVDCPNGYSLTATASPAAGGSISGAGTNPHSVDSFVDLVASPNGGYTFAGWTGDGTGTTTRRVDFVGEDCSLEVTASFEEIIISTPDCSDDFDPTNNGPNGDCTIPPPPDCSGDFDPTNNGPNGDCIEPPPPVDLCPNIEGDQAEVPEGMEVDENGDCVEPAVLPVDVCPNVEGDQAEVPEGMTLNPVTGDCDEDQVLGEIIDRDPKPSKPEPEEPPAVAPSNVQAGVLPFTGGNLLPFLVVSLMLIALGTALTLRRRSEAKL